MTVVLRAHDHTPGTPKPWDSDSFSGSWSEYPIRVFPDHDLGACTEVRRGPYANWCLRLWHEIAPSAAWSHSGKSGQSLNSEVHRLFRGLSP